MYGLADGGSWRVRVHLCSSGLAGCGWVRVACWCSRAFGDGDADSVSVFVLFRSSVCLADSGSRMCREMLGVDSENSGPWFLDGDRTVASVRVRCGRLRCMGAPGGCTDALSRMLVVQRLRSVAAVDYDSDALILVECRHVVGCGVASQTARPCPTARFIRFRRP